MNLFFYAPTSGKTLCRPMPRQRYATSSPVLKPTEGRLSHHIATGKPRFRKFQAPAAVFMAGIRETDYLFPSVKALPLKRGRANGLIGEAEIARTCTAFEFEPVSRSKATNSSNVGSCCMARFITISYIAFREGALKPLVLLFIMLS